MAGEWGAPTSEHLPFQFTPSPSDELGLSEKPLSEPLDDLSSGPIRADAEGIPPGPWATDVDGKPVALAVNHSRLLMDAVRGHRESMTANGAGTLLLRYRS